MYQYDQYDQTIVDERVAQYADQVRRRLSGELSEEEFRPLRLQNGLYMQRHAYMHRIAIPYGNLRSDQMRVLAQIAREHDRGYGHFSTRSNIQFNWIKLEETPEILRKLAAVQMHGIQTSGNCIRNITADQFAGVAPDEVVDPRPLGRNPAPMVDVPSRIRLAAAQVQDRRVGFEGRPRCRADARHGRVSEEERAG